MLTPNYDLEIIQSHAFELSLQTTSLVASLLGTNGQLTPQMIVDDFVELERSYQLLKAHVDSVQSSLDAGYDPDRWLFSF